MLFSFYIIYIDGILQEYNSGIERNDDCWQLIEPFF